MKQQIAPHLERLEGLVANGDERAHEKFVTLQVKVKQIDAVLPYLEKCITKNKEAEQKTIAILEKKRDEELAALEKGTSIDSSTNQSEIDTKNSTSDLYMKVLAENGDISENSQFSEALHNALQDSTNSTNFQESHIDIMNSTPIKSNRPPTNVENSMTPITHSHNYQEQLTNSLDDTIVASASMVQEQAVPVVIEPYPFEASSQADVVGRTAMIDASSAIAEKPVEPAVLNLNPVVEPTPKAEVKPPPIKPKKKKVPPPRPPRRSSSYLSDSYEPQCSPVVDTRQRSSMASTGSPVAPQPPRRSSSYISDNAEPQGSPVSEGKQRQSSDHSSPNVTATSSPIVSAGSPFHRTSNHISDNVVLQGSQSSETRRKQSVDHSTANGTPGSPAIPSRSSGPINTRTSEYLGEDLANVSVFSKIKVGND